MSSDPNNMKDVHDANDFAFDEFFDRDYLAFYAAELNDDTNDDEAHTIAELLQLQPGLRILDLPCGHGRIARRLAAMGATITGIDRSQLFLEHARADADRHGVAVDYREGDMRTLSVDGEFDVVLNWFTSFGYDDDDTLRTQLTRMHRALVPGGRLLLETINLHQRDLQPHETSHTKELVDEHGTHFLIDRYYYDPHDGRLHARRFITRSGQATRTIPWQLRLFPLTELKTWLREAGFANVQAFSGGGEVFRCDSERLIVVAQRQ
tara:strand:+ start:2179 stop:2973 length:795 start_codon:yes stop_codon:yes gene_type:complete